MKKTATPLLLIMGLLFGLFAFTSFKGGSEDDKTATKPYKTKNVIVLVIDGPRHSETWGDSLFQHIPSMSAMTREGVLCSDFRNEGPTYTISGHTAITTGVHQKISNGGKKLPKNPSIFQYYLKQKSLHKNQAWVIASKGKLRVLGNTKNKEWANIYTPSVNCGINASGYGYGKDENTWKDVEYILETHHPSLVLINLLDVDVRGHANQWDNYLRAIKNCDAYAKRLWEIIQSDVQYEDQTTLFITNDHGRHLDGVKTGFVSHGDGCEGCRKISLLALGPDFKQGAIVDKRYDQVDITATIAELLGIDMPTGKGKVIKELFKD